MVYYFIPRPLFMLGSLRRVRERGRKPEDSRITRRRLERDEGREGEAPGPAGTGTGMIPESIPASSRRPGTKPGMVPGPVPDHPNALWNWPNLRRYKTRYAYRDSYRASQESEPARLKLAPGPCIFGPTYPFVARLYIGPHLILVTLD